MPKIYISENPQTAPNDVNRRVDRHVEMPRVPVKGDWIEDISTGEHVALEVTRVVFQQGNDDDFIPVVHAKREVG